MSWSSGKDSTFALATAREEPDVDVVGLLVTMNASPATGCATWPTGPLASAAASVPHPTTAPGPCWSGAAPNRAG